MPEYIKRENVIERIEKIEWYSCNADGKLISGAPDDLDAFVCYFDVMDAVNDIPAADVVEVVRCKDCKHWFDNGTDYCSCDRDALLRERNFFCASGERRGEDDV